MTSFRAADLTVGLSPVEGERPRLTWLVKLEWGLTLARLLPRPRWPDEGLRRELR